MSHLLEEVGDALVLGPSPEVIPVDACLVHTHQIATVAQLELGRALGPRQLGDHEVLEGEHPDRPEGRMLPALPTADRGSRPGSPGVQDQVHLGHVIDGDERAHHMAPEVDRVVDEPAILEGTGDRAEAAEVGLHDDVEVGGHPGLAVPSERFRAGDVPTQAEAFQAIEDITHRGYGTRCRYRAVGRGAVRGLGARPGGRAPGHGRAGHRVHHPRCSTAIRAPVPRSDARCAPSTMQRTAARRPGSAQPSVPRIIHGAARPRSRGRCRGLAADRIVQGAISDPRADRTAATCGIASSTVRFAAGEALSRSPAPGPRMPRSPGRSG